MKEAIKVAIAMLEDSECEVQALEGGSDAANHAMIEIQKVVIILKGALDKPKVDIHDPMYSD